MLGGGQLGLGLFDVCIEGGELLVELVDLGLDPGPASIKAGDPRRHGPLLLAELLLPLVDPVLAGTVLLELVPRAGEGGHGGGQEAEEGDQGCAGFAPFAPPVKDHPSHTS